MVQQGHSRTILSYNNVEGSHLAKTTAAIIICLTLCLRKDWCVPVHRLSRGLIVKLLPCATAGSGGHQGGIVDLPDGSYWGYLMQDDGAIGRMTRICPITWQNDWPLFGRSGHTGTVESSYTKPIARSTDQGTGNVG